MKKIRFDDWTIEIVRDKNPTSNYSIFAHVSKGKMLEFGTSFINKTKDIDIVEWAIHRIKNPPPMSDWEKQLIEESQN